MIAAWQKARNEPATGYLTGAQNQALLRDAAPAVARFDEEQKKLEEASKKAEEEKAKAEAAARAPAPAAAPAAAAAAPAPAAPNVAAAHAVGTGRPVGTAPITARRRGTAAASSLPASRSTLSGGTGTWIRPGSESGTMVGNQSVIDQGQRARRSRSRASTRPGNRVGVFQTATMAARLDGQQPSRARAPSTIAAAALAISALTRAQ